MRKLLYIFIFSSTLLGSCTTKPQSGQRSEVVSPPKRIEVLFLGHDSEHHDSEKLAPMLAIPLFQRGINLTYTEDPGDLNQENLAKYDGLIIYANHDTIAPQQEQALKDFVEGGKGLIPIHSASYCFRNSDWYVDAVGGQFLKHDTATFTAQIVKPEHPVMQGVSEFGTWDETYVHSKLNPDMTVLMERVEGVHREPWTWVRTQGKGRVFYTAYGHDERTWSKPEFQKLVGNGVLWAVSDKAKEQLAMLDVPALTYVDAKVPNYEKRDPAPKFQNPLEAAASQKLIQVPAGFELQLFASEPDIVNPIAMAWDEKGRLWVIETVDYPNSVRDEEGVGDDRIKILEDTNGDGKADKFTVFADSLNIPTSLAFANGGVIVSQAPVFLFLKDTNGDDKADVRQIIMEGWGTGDTHAGPSNLKYGLDNKVWGTVGYSAYKGKVADQDVSFGQGLYRFNPDGKDLEFLARTSNNTWGLGFNENFDIFLSTANNTHSAYYYMPDSYVKRVLAGGDAQGIKKIDGHYAMHTMTPNLRQVDVHGGFTAAAGHNLYTARSFPKEYWNRIAFVNEPTGRVVHQAIVEPDGAGYKEKDGWNLMASSDEWMGPVQAEVGPDGAVWVADWYDFIIQHNPTPTPDRGGYQAETGKGNAYINPLRDHQRGRIYRISYKDAKPYTPVKLDRNKPETLVSALKNDNMFWRTTAQRLLVEAGNTSVLPALYDIVNNQEVDEIGLNAPAVHALWTIHGLGGLSGTNPEALQVAIKSLSHPAAGVRKTAIQVLPKNRQTLDAMLKLGLLQDANQVTRLAALLALAEMPVSDEAGQALYEASLNAENEKDPALAQALFVAAARHQDGFKQAMQKAAAPQPESGAANLAQRIAQSLEKDIRMLERWVGIPAQSAPDVAGKEITIRGTVTKRGDDAVDGILMAQGGNKNGYALYAGEGNLYMLVNQNGKSSTISAPQPKDEGFKVVAQLKQGGAMALQIDGQTVAQGKAAGLFIEQVPYDIRVGRDGKGDMKVGSYKDDYGLDGDFSKAFIEVSANNSNQVSQAVAEADVTVNIKVIKEQMKFDKESFTVKAGQMVELVLENPDFMQHNWVLGMIGSMEKVGAAADKLARDPKGAEKNYVPRIPEVLAATELVNPETSTIIRFRAPDKPGDYPYVCTFPGHWRLMNGMMKVVK